MALQLDYSFKGVSITNAYHKVLNVSGNKNKLNIDIGISVSAEEDIIDNFSFELTSLFHDGSANDTNYTKQVYEYLKSNQVTDSLGTLRDYTLAVDV